MICHNFYQEKKIILLQIKFFELIENIFLGLKLNESKSILVNNNFIFY